MSQVHVPSPACSRSGYRASSLTIAVRSRTSKRALDETSGGTKAAPGSGTAPSATAASEKWWKIIATFLKKRTTSGARTGPPIRAWARRSARQERVTGADGIAIGRAVDDEVALGVAHDPRREEIPADEPRAMRRLAEPDRGAGPEVDQPDLPVGTKVDHLVGSEVRVTHSLEVLALAAWQPAPVPLEEQADRRAVAP